jgi:tRNA threonylcarbamoyladenosine biosynthesis protein TsaB
MRVSEGIVRILEWHEIPVYSFYHYNVPEIINNKAGIWISRAFKGEFFLYEWSESKKGHKLIPSKLVEDVIDRDLQFYFGHQSINDIPGIFTKDLIKENSKVLFNIIKEKKMRKNLFYYRSLSEEYGKKND